MGPATTWFYRTVFRKYSTIAVFSLGTAMMWERFINVTVDNYYNEINKGVSCQINKIIYMMDYLYIFAMV